MQTPTMVQYTTAPKSSRGSRLGRGAGSTSTMEQYGYSQPGANITVSPTFSNIGNPTFSNIGNPTTYTEGLSIGDVSLSNLSETRLGPQPPRPSSGGGGGGGQNGGSSGGGGGQNGGSSGGGGGQNGGSSGGETRDNTLARALQGAVKTGQSRNPRVTRSEIKSIMQETDQGPRGLKNAIDEGDVNIGGKALKFLNKQLKKEPVGPVSKPTPGELQDKPRVAPFNSGSNPYAPFLSQMQAGANKAKDNKGDGKEDNKKAEAKSKAQAAIKAEKQEAKVERKVEKQEAKVERKAEKQEAKSVKAEAKSKAQAAKKKK